MNQEKNINTQAAAEVMTTDEFHRQLVENTEAINKERMAYEHKKIQLQQECDCQKSLADSILESIQRERQELELEFSSKKSSPSMIVSAAPTTPAARLPNSILPAWQRQRATTP